MSGIKITGCSEGMLKALERAQSAMEPRIKNLNKIHRALEDVQKDGERFDEKDPHRLSFGSHSFLVDREFVGAFEEILLGSISGRSGNCSPSSGKSRSLQHRRSRTMASPTSTFDQIALCKLRESLCAISDRMARLPRTHHKAEIDMITDMVQEAIQDIDGIEKGGR